MGDEATSTRRLNLAQSFNPMGSLLGMYVAMNFIQNRLNPMDTVERSQLSDTEFAAVRDSDLMVLIAPYLIIGLVILAMLIVIRMVKMPKNGDQSHNINFLPTLKRIFRYTPLPRRSGGTILLCRCADYVLDIYHSIWYALFHVGRDGRESCGSALTTV